MRDLTQPLTLLRHVSGFEDTKVQSTGGLDWLPAASPLLLAPLLARRLLLLLLVCRLLLLLSACWLLLQLLACWLLLLLA